MLKDFLSVWLNSQKIQLFWWNGEMQKTKEFEEVYKYWEIVMKWLVEVTMSDREGVNKWCPPGWLRKTHTKSYFTNSTFFKTQNDRSF